MSPLKPITTLTEDALNFVASNSPPTLYNGNIKYVGNNVSPGLSELFIPNYLKKSKMTSNTQPNSHSLSLGTKLHLKMKTIFQINDSFSGLSTSSTH